MLHGLHAMIEKDLLLSEHAPVEGRENNIQDYPSSKEDYPRYYQMEVEDHADSCFVYGSASPDDCTSRWSGK